MKIATGVEMLEIPATIQGSQNIHLSYADLGQQNDDSR